MDVDGIATYCLALCVDPVMDAMVRWSVTVANINIKSSSVTFVKAELLHLRNTHQEIN